MVRAFVAGLLALAAGAVAETINLDFNVSWVMANPDGLADRKVIGINGEFPLPLINVTKGDRLVVNMYNGLGDKSTSIHWHGMFQNGTNSMDGASMFTQCPIPPGSSFTYNFTVEQTGTYWYHCHTDYCYPDGYRQALIVHDPEAPFYNDYEEEFVMTLSDWYHDLMEDLSTQFLSLYNPTGAEPVPNSFLMNDGQNQTFHVKPNTTYLLRIINSGNFIAQYFYIEGHNFTIVEVDGVYTEPQEASTLYVAIAQRYSVLLTTANSTEVNYKIVTVADSDLMDTIPSNLQLNQTNWLVLNENAPLEQAVVTAATSDDIVAFDDFTLVPSDRMALLPEPDIQINVTVYMVNLINGFNYAELNNITYTIPKVPSLYTALSAGDLRTSEVVYGEYTHPIVLGHNQVVEIVLNNGDTGSHPFHLHGHTFQVINREPPIGPDFNSYRDGDPVAYDANNHTDFPPIPIRRDTVVLPPQGFVVMRFVADNPGVWAFHCHIDWHMASGLAMTFVEAPELIPTHVEVPDDHYAACAAAAVPTVGNAAANAQNFLDLTGQNAQPKDIPDGFTPRGIVAMTFTVLSAVLGIISIIYYGLADLKHAPKSAPAARDSSEGENAVTTTSMPKHG
ncbi:ferrooxidoreductase Fet3 [Sporothrix brasiliensis 5110]|uniref:Ferrooxidoreductase Fet3 n=1 Tax=Sporothrix brasiliensis 5110 TaxID=1398154 RepID=A0A0C2FMN0_9PEZI|nr:ferrooxidoreductase Fet3 [Sporothrix brasiliensis 5110]KIH92323.1 ferrooxidoreductase Fet3 [Sporothrix brasiliensis 5110]